MLISIVFIYVFAFVTEPSTEENKLKSSCRLRKETIKTHFRYGATEIKVLASGFWPVASGLLAGCCRLLLGLLLAGGLAPDRLLAGQGACSSISY